MAEYKDTPQEIDGMPKGVPYIICNEAAERFSFYGMKCVLTIFMVDYLHRMGDVFVDQGMSNAEATERYHTFTALVYFFPLLGALLSDTVLGKYRTILWLSVVYCAGHAALALMGTPPLTAAMWLVVGLWLISIGSGGIKPCVSAHVGDQFGSSNKHLLTKVYQWFYFSINFGSFISTLLTPWLLEHYGPHWAFGVPGVLMAAATVVFWMGRRVFIHIPPGGKGFLKETFSWTGISAVLKLSIIFAFVAVFWALFDQTGSSWVLQAKNLNRYWLGKEWLASQIQAVNPILVLILIPLFQFVVYPAIDKVFRLTPIRKIGLGLFIMVGGFAIVAVLQERIDAGALPSISWQFLAYAVLTASEVMVSITCLEFAYTQAPKTMKSVVMAVFLASVSLGNVFTVVVNGYIQTPVISSLATDLDLTSLKPGDLIRSSKWNATFETDGDTQLIRETGLDQITGTDDDTILALNNDGQLASIDTPAKTVFEAAAKTIETMFLADPAADNEKQLPTNDAGNAALESVADSFGNPIRYQLQSRDSYQLISEGADRKDQTQWDLVLTGSVSRSESKTTQESPDSEPYFNWLERKTIELKSGGDQSKVAEIEQEILKSRGGTETGFSRDFTVGGRTLLEGASYFWFWTKCILATALLFVPVGLLYKEKTYIQGEE